MLTREREEHIEWGWQESDQTVCGPLLISFLSMCSFYLVVVLTKMRTCGAHHHSMQMMLINVLALCVESPKEKDCIIIINCTWWLFSFRQANSIIVLRLGFLVWRFDSISEQRADCFPIATAHIKIWPWRKRVLRRRMILSHSCATNDRLHYLFLGVTEKESGRRSPSASEIALSHWACQ